MIDLRVVNELKDGGPTARPKGRLTMGQCRDADWLDHSEAQSYRARRTADGGKAAMGTEIAT